MSEMMSRTRWLRLHGRRQNLLRIRQRSGLLRQSTRNCPRPKNISERWTTGEAVRRDDGRSVANTSRYVGYVYETQGYDVEFTGAIEGFEDMGRDLIARRG